MQITSYLFRKYMARYLVIFNDNHSEEFDVNGFRVMSDKEVLKFVRENLNGKTIENPGKVKREYTMPISVVKK